MRIGLGCRGVWKARSEVRCSSLVARLSLLSTDRCDFNPPPRFQKLLGGLTFLQAVIRRQQTQGRFLKDLMTTFRPFRMKAGAFKDLRDIKTEGDIKGNACCMMTCYSNVKSADLDEGARHLYR